MKLKIIHYLNLGLVEYGNISSYSIINEFLWTFDAI
jgi:hypothetical protein